MSTDPTICHHGDVTLSFTSPLRADDVRYTLSGTVSGSISLDGASVLVRSPASRLVEELFVNGEGNFAAMVELQHDACNTIEVVLRDEFGHEVLRSAVSVIHGNAAAEPPKRLLLDPPWSRFLALIRRCLDLASELANATGCDRLELFDYVHAQERYAEDALSTQSSAAYGECWTNLERYSAYLSWLRAEAVNRQRGPPAPTPPTDPGEAFRERLGGLWRHVRAVGRGELEARLQEIAKNASGLGPRSRRGSADVAQKFIQLNQALDEIARLLEGSNETR